MRTRHKFVKRRLQTTKKGLKLSPQGTQPRSHTPIGPGLRAATITDGRTPLYCRDVYRGGQPEPRAKLGPGPAIVPEMGQRLKNIAITLLRYLGVAVALALIVLVLEVVVGVLLIEVEAIFN